MASPRFSAVLVLLGTLAAAPACNAAPGRTSAPDGPYALVLGTAQDGGLPQIGCDDEACRRARRDPRASRLVTSLLIADPRDGRRWLVDASPDLPAQVELARGHPPTRSLPGPRPPLFDGIFVTHAHMGHYGGLLHLGPEAYGAQGVPLYGTPRLCEYLRTNGPWSLLVESGALVPVELPPGEPLWLADDLAVTAVPVPHREELSDTVAFLVEGPERSLLYLPDIDKWERWDTPIEDWVARVDVALLDASFFAEGEIPGRDMASIPHPFVVESLARFATLPPAERAKVRFTHLNHTNPLCDPHSPESDQVRAAGLAVAAEGERFEL